MDTTKCTNYPFVSQIMVYTVFTLTRVFLRLLPRVVFPFNKMDAGLVWKELVILFFMRVVKLLVMCCTAMSLPPGVYVRMGNLIV